MGGGEVFKDDRGPKPLTQTPREPLNFRLKALGAPGLRGLLDGGKAQRFQPGAAHGREDGFHLVSSGYLAANGAPGT